MILFHCVKENKQRKEITESTSCPLKTLWRDLQEWKKSYSWASCRQMIMNLCYKAPLPFTVWKCSLHTNYVFNCQLHWTDNQHHERAVLMRIKKNETELYSNTHKRRLYSWMLIIWCLENCFPWKSYYLRHENALSAQTGSNIQSILLHEEINFHSL